MSHFQRKIILPASLRDWVLHPGSFMKRLTDHGIINSRIQVLQQIWQVPSANERKALGLNDRSIGLVREVLISNKSHDLMFARTVIPFNTLTGKHKQLARLKNRSLGSLLFKDPSVQRSQFEIALVTKGSKLHTAISQATKGKYELLWSRRSLFTLDNKPLLLTEVFLPGIVKIGDKHVKTKT